MARCFMIPKGFIPFSGGKVFAIMEKLQKRGQLVRILNCRPAPTGRPDASRAKSAISLLLPGWSRGSPVSRWSDADRTRTLAAGYLAVAAFAAGGLPAVLAAPLYVRTPSASETLSAVGWPAGRAGRR